MMRDYPEAHVVLLLPTCNSLTSLAALLSCSVDLYTLHKVVASRPISLLFPVCCSAGLYVLMCFSSVSLEGTGNVVIFSRPLSFVFRFQIHASKVYSASFFPANFFGVFFCYADKQPPKQPHFGIIVFQKCCLITSLM